MNTVLTFLGNPVVIAVILGALSLFVKNAFSYRVLVKKIVKVVRDVKAARDPKSPDGKAFSPVERKEIVDGILSVITEAGNFIPKKWRIK